MHSNLAHTCFPEGIPNPHSCGTAPFVPDVSGPVQNSCGSYKDGFDPETGCNKYKTLSPDDLWIAEHGCDDIGDCRDGVFPDPGEPWPKQMFPATGFIPTAQNGMLCSRTAENFTSGDEEVTGNLIFRGLLWLVLLWVGLRLLCGKCSLNKK